MSEAVDLLPPRLRATFDALEGAGIPYVVLRGFDPIDELATSFDIDMFIPASALASAEPVLEACGWRRRRTQVGRLPHLFFDAWEGPGGLVRSIDVVTALCFGDESRVLRGDTAVAQRSVLVEGIRVPSPWMTAFCFALHVLLDKGGLSEANIRRGASMRARCEPAPDGQDELRTLFGAEALSLTQRFLDHVGTPDVQVFQSLRADAERLPALTARPWLARWHRARVRWRQLVRPVARVAILGIDGSGKSTVVETLRKTGGTVRVHSGYLGYNSYRTLPARWLASAKKSRWDRGATTGIVSRLLNSLDVLWRPFELAARMLIAEHRAEIVLYDRFPFGQDDGRPTSLYGRCMLAYTRAARALLPSPDLLVMLDGDDHTIWSRKREMPFETHVATQARYRELIRGLPWDTAVVRSDGALTDTIEGLRQAMRGCAAIQRKLYGA
jgi:thymidylate kinase